MQDLNDKITTDQLTAVEWNELPSEVQNVIEAFGIVLTSADLNQLGKAIANYVGAGDFYSETGVADVYVATKIGVKQGPTVLAAITDGLSVRFRPGNANTGASTLNVNALGAKSIVREDLSALQAGDLATTRDAVLRYRQSSDNFLLMNSALSSESSPIPARGYIDGFQTRRDLADTDHIIEIEAGIARDSTNTRTMERTTQISKSILGGTWVEGDNNGGFPSALTLTAGETYHVFLIRKTSDGSIDAGFDTALNAANLLLDATGYLEFLLIWSIILDGSSNIESYIQHGSYNVWTTPRLDVDLTDPALTEIIHTLDFVPKGISVEADVGITLSPTSTSNPGTELIYGPGDGDSLPTPVLGSTAVFGSMRGDARTIEGAVRILTNTSRQIRTRISSSNAALHQYITVSGWIHPRGKDA